MTSPADLAGCSRGRAHGRPQPAAANVVPEPPPSSRLHRAQPYRGLETALRRAKAVATDLGARALTPASGDGNGLDV